MKQYEYDHVSMLIGSSEQLLRQLNELGRDGWQVVSVLAQDGALTGDNVSLTIVFLMMRERR